MFTLFKNEKIKPNYTVINDYMNHVSTKLGDFLFIKDLSLGYFTNNGIDEIIEILNIYQPCVLIFKDNYKKLFEDIILKYRNNNNINDKFIYTSLIYHNSLDVRCVMFKDNDFYKYELNTELCDFICENAKVNGFNEIMKI